MNFEDMYEIKGLIMKGSFAEAKKCVSSKTLQLFSVKEIHYKDAEYIEKVEDEEVAVFWADELCVKIATAFPLPSSRKLFPSDPPESFWINSLFYMQ